MNRWFTFTLLLMMALHSKAQTLSDTTQWYNKTHQLHGITIEKKRERYRRKNNPAVELMRKVIEEKRRNDLKNRAYFRRDKYQKVTLAANDLRLSDITEGTYSFIPGVLNQIEVCPYNNKLILPLNIVEKSVADIYRSNPQQEKEIVFGSRSDGVSKLMAGSFINETLQDCFKDINLYDNAVRLFHHDLPSPIGNTAISFYRYFITDTLNYGGSHCYKLYFYPNNGKDFGFSGSLYVLADSTYRLRYVELSLPRESMVNFVRGMAIWQDFGTIGNDGWGVYGDDMIIEFDLLGSEYALVKKSRIASYKFDPLPDEAFTEKSLFAQRQKAKTQGREFWKRNRLASLTSGERYMSTFIDSLKTTRKYRLFAPILRLMTDNHVSTGSEWTPSMFDFGPLLSTISRNPMDGLRLRFGGRTTANLSSRLFLDGFYAYGCESHNHYYRARFTYSFNRKEYLPDEFPIRSVSFTSTKDAGMLSDKFLSNDKDNVFTSFRWMSIDKMIIYNRQLLECIREEESGLRSTLSLSTEHDKSWGAMSFDYRSTELKMALRYSPGERWVNSKRGRHKLNHDAPIYTLSHTMGINDFLGGDYNYHLTEASLYERLWLKSWGNVDINVNIGALWNSVPYYLLIMPASNLSYISQEGMFSLMKNMEMLNDRYASLNLKWDLNGKLFNRLPLINRLGWRESISVKTLWGALSSKNTCQNLPLGVHALEGSKPYVELSFGIHNIFRFLHLEYVRRLTYLDFSNASKQGIRGCVKIEF